MSDYLRSLILSAFSISMIVVVVKIVNGWSDVSRTDALLLVLVFTILYLTLCNNLFTVSNNVGEALKFVIDKYTKSHTNPA
jgi:uncharacterized membrane protein